MATEVRIPKIGMTATSMTLSEWMVEDGEQVTQGDIIYTIETDKTATEVEAPATGILRVTGIEGEDYMVGTVVGTIE